MDPTFFGEEPTWKIGTTNYLRDVFETEIFRAFRESGKPIFGICRGCQLINVLMGGTVYQDLPSQNPDAYIRHSQAAPGAYPTHHITVEKDSVIAHALGKRRTSIPAIIRRSATWLRACVQRRRRRTAWWNAWNLRTATRSWPCSGIRKICGRSIRKCGRFLRISSPGRRHSVRNNPAQRDLTLSLFLTAQAL